MPAPYMTYKTDCDTREFRWHGGEYIEAGYMGEDGEWYAFDVINVWDYAAGAPRIPRTLDALQARCDEWIADHADDEA